LAQPLNSTAAALTGIAITLHRQLAYRAAGLELFEQLLGLGIREAAAALDVLDRKPYQHHPYHAPIRRQRRRPRPQ
jgi:hypothetical protein